MLSKFTFLGQVFSAFFHKRRVRPWLRDAELPEYSGSVLGPPNNYKIQCDLQNSH